MLTQYMPNIFRTGRPTNFKLGTQTEHEDPHQRQAPWPPRSKVKVARSHDASDRCWPITRERKVTEIPKLVPRLRTPCAIRRTSFKVKSSKVKVTRSISTKTEIASYFPNGTQMEHKYLGINDKRHDDQRRKVTWSV